MLYEIGDWGLGNGDRGFGFEPNNKYPIHLN